jgi:hypothetical protein
VQLKGHPDIRLKVWALTVRVLAVKVAFMVAMLLPPLLLPLPLLPPLTVAFMVVRVPAWVTAAPAVWATVTVESSKYSIRI